MDQPGDGESLREKAVAAIAATRFVPEKGRNRLGAMVEGRPDWVISRQRAWGVPITLFVNRATGQYLSDPAVNARIIAAVREQGVDAWSEAAAQGFLGPDYALADYERVTDILDVWFDSGCTHAFVLESGRWPDLQWPADLYLEGSDQHRGWFQSSLLQSCGTRGRAPYGTVLTHGFTMDQNGRKMSKSLGNTTNPIDLMKDYGADILRLWAATVDFTEDHRIGKEILTGVADQYRKLRNTFRYLLGALDGFSEAERVAPAAMPELERWVLHRLAEIDAELRRASSDFDFNAYVTTISTFVNNDLSALVFDIRKDSLYCDAASHPTRRAYRSLLSTLLDALTRWLAPVLVFTAEEVWTTSNPGSVHIAEWPAIDPAWLDPALGTRWQQLRALRSLATMAIEPARRDKLIGSSLEARLTLAAAHADAALIASVDFAELCIVSDVVFDIDPALEAGAIVNVEKIDAEKCARCWRHLPDVNEETGLCGRCDAVVAV
jgi:isoleucyl-tRNA synthetase